MNRLDICNLALGRIGVGSQHVLNDYEEDTEAGRQVRRLWPYAVKTVAREGFWPFLLRSAPGQAVTNPSSAFGYAYAVPPDAARIFAVESVGTDFQEAMIQRGISPYANARGVLTTNVQAGVIWYAAIPDDDYDVWDQGFCDAVAWLLARELAMALKAEQGYFKAAAQAYAATLADARATSMNEHGRGADLLPATLRAR